MTPIKNALLAEGYIIAIIALISNGEKIFGEQETIIIPIAMLSLLVLSVAIMALLFFYKPLSLYIDGQKTEAFAFFLKTLLSFGIITVVVFCIALLLNYMTHV